MSKKIDIGSDVNRKNYKKLSPKQKDELLTHILYEVSQSYKTPMIYFLREKKVVFSILLIYTLIFLIRMNETLFENLIVGTCINTVVLLVWYKFIDMSKKSSIL